MSDDASDGQKSSNVRQMIGSLVVAVLIVVVVIALVTARIGPGESGRHGGDERQQDQDNSGPGSSDRGHDHRFLPS